MKSERAAESLSTAEADVARSVRSGSRESDRSSTAGGREVSSSGGSEGGFGGVVYMLRSLGSPMQVK